MNKVQLIGRLTHDPEIRRTTSGKNVATFTLAINRKTKDEITDFINCVAWEKRADVIAKYVFKGNRLGVCGSIQTRTWEKDDGKKGYATEVIVDEIEFLENKKENQTNQEPIQSNYNNNYNENDDLPFF